MGFAGSRRARVAMLAAALAAIGLHSESAWGGTATWNIVASGSWWSSSSWNFDPVNTDMATFALGGYDVNITQGDVIVDRYYTVGASNYMAYANRLTVDVDTTVIVNTGFKMGATQPIINGQLTLNYSSCFQVSNAGTDIEGSGRVNLRGGGIYNPYVHSIYDPRTLTLGSSLQVAGYGNIGGERVINHGTISANQSGQTLGVYAHSAFNEYVPGSGYVPSDYAYSDGVMEATNGGILQIAPASNNTFTNYGTIRYDNTGQLIFNGSGGKIVNDVTGSLTPTASNVSLTKHWSFKIGTFVNTGHTIDLNPGDDVAFAMQSKLEGGAIVSPGAGANRGQARIDQGAFVTFTDVDLRSASFLMRSDSTLQLLGNSPLKGATFAPEPSIAPGYSISLGSDQDLAGGIDTTLNGFAFLTSGPERHTITLGDTPMLSPSKLKNNGNLSITGIDLHVNNTNPSFAAIDTPVLSLDDVTVDGLLAVTPGHTIKISNGAYDANTLRYDGGTLLLGHGATYSAFSSGVYQPVTASSNIAFENAEVADASLLAQFEGGSGYFATYDTLKLTNVTLDGALFHSIRTSYNRSLGQFVDTPMPQTTLAGTFTPGTHTALLMGFSAYKLIAEDGLRFQPGTTQITGAVEFSAASANARVTNSDGHRLIASGNVNLTNGLIFDNQGTLEIQAGGSFGGAGGTVVNTADTSHIIADGTLATGLSLSAGRLSGSGLVSGYLVVGGDPLAPVSGRIAVAPGSEAQGGNPPVIGTLSVGEYFSLGSDAFLELQIAAADSVDGNGAEVAGGDRLDVAGSANLLGTLEIDFLNGFTLNDGDRLKLIHAGGFYQTAEQVTLSFPDGAPSAYWLQQSGGWLTLVGGVYVPPAGQQFVLAAAAMDEYGAAVPQSFHDAAAWGGSAIPTDIDSVLISDGGYHSLSLAADTIIRRLDVTSSNTTLDLQDHRFTLTDNPSNNALSVSGPGVAALNLVNSGLTTATLETLDAEIGVGFGNRGLLSVGPNTTLSVGRVTTVGANGEGQVNVSGGRLETTTLYVGNGADGVGSISFQDGSDSVAHYVHVGSSGNARGSLQVDSGSALATDYLWVAPTGDVGERATGLVSVTNSSTLRVSTSLHLGGGYADGYGGDAKLVIGSNSRVEVGSMTPGLTPIAHIYARGELELNGGQLSVFSSPDGLTSVLGTLTNEGFIHGNGTIDANILNTGTIAPGFSPGTITIMGDFTQAPGGVLNMEVGPGGYDSLVVLGNADIQGEIHFSFIDGYTPAPGMLVTLFDVHGSSSFSPTFTGLPAGSTYDFSGGVFTLTSVPEPTIMAFAGIGGLMMLRRRVRHEEA